MNAEILTFTDLRADHVLLVSKIKELQSELAAVKRENERLSNLQHASTKAPTTGWLADELATIRHDMHSMNQDIASLAKHANALEAVVYGINARLVPHEGAVK